MASKRQQKLDHLAHERAAIMAAGDTAAPESGAETPSGPKRARKSKFTDLLTISHSDAVTLWETWSERWGRGRNPFAPHVTDDQFLLAVTRGHAGSLDMKVPALRRFPSGAEARELREYSGLSAEQLSTRCFTIADAIEEYERTSKLPRHLSRNIYNEDEPIITEVIDQAAYANFLAAVAVIHVARAGAEWPALAPQLDPPTRPEPQVMYKELYSDELAHFTKIHAVARGDVPSPFLSNVPPPESLLRVSTT